MLVDCRWCQALVDGREIGLIERSDGETGFDEKWTMAQCPRCKSPILVCQVRPGDQDPWDTPTRLFPLDDYKADWRLPTTLRNCFAEAISCASAKSYTATAIMCRRTLEALCRHQGSKAKLAAALKELHDKKIIDDRLFEWADALRSDGNLAAHE